MIRTTWIPFRGFRVLSKAFSSKYCYPLKYVTEVCASPWEDPFLQGCLTMREMDFRRQRPELNGSPGWPFSSWAQEVTNRLWQERCFHSAGGLRLSPAPGGPLGGQRSKVIAGVLGLFGGRVFLKMKTFESQIFWGYVNADSFFWLVNNEEGKKIMTKLQTF